jgi:cell division protein FtsB
MRGDPGARPRERVEPQPGLHLIRRRSRGLIKRGRGTRFAPIAVVTAICAAALVFGVLLEQVFLAQSAFKLARIRREMAEAEDRNQALVLRMTKLQSPRRIERFARARLDMVDPGGVEYIVADVGRPDGAVAVRPPRGGPLEGEASPGSP